MLKKKLFFIFSLVIQQIIGQINNSILFEGVNRSYIYYLPSTYNESKSYPLLFALHGFTQNAETMMQATKFNDVAEEKEFIVVYPNGINNAWNTNTGFPGGSNANDVGFIQELIHEFKQNFSLDSSRIYACGFSAGGFLSHFLACEGNTEISGIASVAGTMSSNAFSSCSNPKSMPVLQIHGTSDAVVSYNGSFANVSVPNTLNLWKTKNNCSDTPSITYLENTVSEGSSVEKHEYSCSNSRRLVLLKIIGGGHTWPSASASFGTGNVNRDIDASREIWNFFEETHTLSIQNLEKNEQILLYPNPSEEIIHLNSSFPDSYYSILNSEWKLLDQGTTKHSKIDISKLVSGIYFIHFENNNKTLKFIKK